jgi:hypothetical protein
LQSLIEKPNTIVNDIMGSGTFLCSPEIFLLLLSWRSSDIRRRLILSVYSMICCRRVSAGRFFQLAGTYVNINDRDSLALARYHDRDLHFANNRKALLIYAEGDEESIAFTLERYRETALFDEIFVVLPDSSVIQRRASDCRCAVDCLSGGLCAVRRKKLRYALQRIQADIVVLTEADYSFFRARCRQAVCLSARRRYGDRYAHHAPIDRTRFYYARRSAYRTYCIGKVGGNVVVGSRSTLYRYWLYLARVLAQHMGCYCT